MSLGRLHTLKSGTRVENSTYFTTVGSVRDKHDITVRIIPFVGLGSLVSTTNLTLIFSCVHLGRAYERVRAVINFKMYVIYLELCSFGQKSHIWHYFFCVSTLGADANACAHTLTLKCMMYINILGQKSHIRHYL